MSFRPLSPFFLEGGPKDRFVPKCKDNKRVFYYQYLTLIKCVCSLDAKFLFDILWNCILMNQDVHGLVGYICITCKPYAFAAIGGVP